MKNWKWVSWFQLGLLTIVLLLVVTVCVSALPWQIETVDATADVGNHASLALDSSDHPHISYYDETNSDLKYAYQDAGGWHIETVDSAGAVTGSYITPPWPWIHQTTPTSATVMGLTVSSSTPTRMRGVGTLRQWTGHGGWAMRAPWPWIHQTIPPHQLPGWV